jgi:DNA-binding response OmpR family regulator
MPTLLVIDDNAEHLDLVNRVMTARGYRVLVASDAERGLEIAVEQQPDAILLDLGLPDVDGQTLVGWIRRVPALAHTPIIACTAWPEETARAMVEAYGCNGYIGKPIQVTELDKQIAAYLRRPMPDQ